MANIRNHATPAQGTPSWPRVTAVLATALALLALASATVTAQEPLPNVTTLASTHDFATTVERLEQAIADEGLTLLTTIDHAANAESVELELLPTTVFLFGNPRAGTPLMQAAPTFGLDLPQRMLVWESEDGDVFVTWRAPTVLAHEHGLAPDQAPLPNIAALLETLARTAAGAP
ncbi:MAG: DUF302 domain-containing protein [Trueperaceae bacterium]